MRTIIGLIIKLLSELGQKEKGWGREGGNERGREKSRCRENI